MTTSVNLKKNLETCNQFGTEELRKSTFVTLIFN